MNKFMKIGRSLYNIEEIQVIEPINSSRMGESDYGIVVKVKHRDSNGIHYYSSRKERDEAFDEIMKSLF